MNQFSSEALWWSHQQQQQTTQPPTSPSSKYKGVVPQPNGRWGAQIYENNHRLWLGTFDSQEAAALSYDRAASMFRGSDANLNFHQQNSQSPKQDNEETEDEDIQEEDEREHMFEKPLTPSDVGKLNRLVIPKQHAEKYFPLAGGGGGGGESGGEKGLLLSFEDESGKLWRFRYSYWNSSQSYVLTKGWSRFVKEKQLDAGDVVWFERRRLDAQHLFIRWRRRVPPVQDSGATHYPPHQSITPQQHTASAWTQVFYSAHPYPSHLHGPLSYQQQPDCLHAAPSVEPVVQNPSTPPANTKRFRLFGVNLDCQLDECEPSRSDGSSQGRGHFLSSQGHEASSHNSSYKDYNFSSGDIDETRYDRGRDLSM